MDSTFASMVTFRSGRPLSLATHYGWDHEWSHESTGKPVQSVEQLLTEIDARFLANREVECGNLILLMHDEMFQDHFEQSHRVIDGLK